MILKLTFAHPLSVGYLIKSNLQAARGIRILFKTEAPHKRPGKQDKTLGTGVAARVTHTKGGQTAKERGRRPWGQGGHGGSEKLGLVKQGLDTWLENLARISLSKAVFIFVS